jgi:Domain of unknown function (DUF4907)
MNHDIFKNKNQFMKSFNIGFFMLLLVPFYIQTHARQTFRLNTAKQIVLSVKTDSLTYQIITGINHTYGYDIYKNNQKMIHQPSIPCINGNKGFAKKGDAKKIALLVIEKIRKGEMPPTLTIQEMKNLGVVL